MYVAATRKARLRVLTKLPILNNIGAYPEWWAQRTPDAAALISDDREITYKGFSDAVRRFAKALLALGVEKGDRVATLQTPHPDFAVAFLGTSLIGAIWVGLNPKYQPAELRYVVGDAEPKIILARGRVGDRSFVSDVTAWKVVMPSVEHIVLYGDETWDSALSYGDYLEAGDTISDEALQTAASDAGNKDPCLIVYTSGSTGAPKGALLHHKGVALFSAMQNRLWPVSPLKTLNYFPINHIGSLIDVMMPTVVAGGAMRLLEAFDPERALDVMLEEKVSFWASVPSVFAMQFDIPDVEKRDFSAVQLAVWEGARLSAELARRLGKLCPRLATNYGMTETTSAITIIEPTDDIEVLTETVGLPAPDVEVRIANADGDGVPLGDAGEIVVRSERNFLGYWRRPQATKDAFTDDGFFRTGDLGVMREDGRIKLVGRLKEMYKSGGYNVYPKEIEAVIEGHPGVAQAAVVAAPDDTWGEIGVAFVSPKAGAGVDDLEAWCEERLANYKRPKRYVIEAELPLLPIGKIDKSALKKRAVEPTAS